MATMRPMALGNLYGKLQAANQGNTQFAEKIKQQQEQSSQPIQEQATGLQSSFAQGAQTNDRYAAPDAWQRFGGNALRSQSEDALAQQDTLQAGNLDTLMTRAGAGQGSGKRALNQMLLRQAPQQEILQSGFSGLKSNLEGIQSSAALAGQSASQQASDRIQAKKQAQMNAQKLAEQKKKQYIMQLQRQNQQEVQASVNAEQQRYAQAQQQRQNQNAMEQAERERVMAMMMRTEALQNIPKQKVNNFSGRGIMPDMRPR